MLDVLRPDRLTRAVAERLFLLRCKSNNLSNTTQALYASRLGMFRRWVERSLLQPADVTAVYLRQYLDELRSTGIKDISVDCSFRILKTFWGFLHRDGLIVSDPMEKVDRPRIEERLIQPLSQDQLRSLLLAIPTKSSLGLRDFALLSLIADSGLRVQEALSLAITDLDFAAGMAKVMGKGRRERAVPFGQAVKRALLEWLRARGDIPGIAALWVNRFGHTITSRQVLRRIKEYGKAAGIEGVRISPHTLRHTFAVTFLRNGGDPLTLQKILGHSDLTMTQRYVKLTGEDLAAKHRHASPLDRLGPLANERKRVRLR